MLVHIQHVKLDMKNEKKTASVLILIFPGKNALWNHRKSLKNGSTKLFVSLRKFNHTFFWLLLHTSTSKVTYKGKTCFVCGWKFQFFVIFTLSKGKKQYANPFPLKLLARYVEVYDKTRMSSYKKLKNIRKQDYIVYVH